MSGDAGGLPAAAAAAGPRIPKRAPMEKPGEGSPAGPQDTGMPVAPLPPGAGPHQAHASSQVPEVLAREYSVARFSKKLVCSTAFSISSSQGSGFFSML